MFSRYGPPIPWPDGLWFPPLDQYGRYGKWEARASWRHYSAWARSSSRALARIKALWNVIIYRLCSNGIFWRLYWD